MNTWVENPYWQFFCGETYLQTEAPIDPSSLMRWRKRIGEEGVETLLAASIDAVRRGGVIRKCSVQQVIVDHRHAQSHRPSHRQPIAGQEPPAPGHAAEDNGLKLRQNYNRVAPRLAAQIGRYAHAKQFKRMRKAVKTLRTRVGRVHREGTRQLHMLPEVAKVQDLLERTACILTQRMKDKNKLYALHAPEVECISKGKARTPYEFGVKVSIATTLKEGLVVGMRSMPGNPYDGHTLAETLEQVSILTGTDKPPATAIVDKGYRGVEIESVRILRSGQKRGITRALKAMIKRRSAIEPAIGHMKMDGRLVRNPLKRALGDALHAVMCGAGHNLRMILAALRLLCARVGLPMQKAIAALIAPGLHVRTARS